MLFLKIILCTVVCVAVCAVLKQFKPEFLPFVVACSAICIVMLVADEVKDIADEFTTLLSDNEFIGDGYIIILIKVLLIAVISRLTSDFCRDCGFGTLASNVELAGKIIMLSFSLPVIKVIVELVQGLLV